eukprot:gene12979-6059_t
MWFHKWKENVERAVAKRQKLIVFFFKGEKGKGKVNWDDLPDPEKRKQGVGMGASQKAEVAYLDRMGIAYEERDVIDFEKQLPELHELIPDE